MIRRSVLVLLATTAIAIPASTMQVSAAGDDALQMVSVDVEGGGGTLFVTPHGKTLLIDSGNPENSRVTGDHPSSERIVNAMTELGVKKIDYLITTHYHGDHIGGLEGLMKRVKIETFIDHGENREVRGTQGPSGLIGPDWRNIPLPGQAPPGGGRGGAGRGPGGPGGAGVPLAPPADPNVPPPGTTAAGYIQYLKLVGNHHHIVAKPGFKLSLDGMNIEVIGADAKFIDKPLPGAGEQNPSCAGMPGLLPNGGEENTRSVSSIITYGKVKIAAFGDLTWDREKDLFCPIDKVGKVDVYLASHHGTMWSGSPAMLNSLQPIVTVMGDSAGKGDDPERAKTIQANPRFQGLWRLHMGRGHADIDGDPNMIANPDLDPAKDKDFNIRLRIRKNGEITVINERNGFNKTYRAGG